MSDIMNNLYTRVELNGAMITPNDILLLVRDYNKRLVALENRCKECNGIEEPTSNRRGTDKVSKRKVPAS